MEGSDTPCERARAQHAVRASERAPTLTDTPQVIGDNEESEQRFAMCARERLECASKEKGGATHGAHGRGRRRRLAHALAEREHPALALLLRVGGELDGRRVIRREAEAVER